jgi:hypothetical protein
MQFKKKKKILKVFFEVKTSLGAPHTFYSRSHHAKIVRSKIKSRESSLAERAYFMASTIHQLETFV